MLKTIGTYLKYGNTYCGIEHVKTVHGNTIYVTTLKKQKNEVNVDSFLEFETVEEVSSGLPKHQHAVLTINDEQVLAKKIESPLLEDIKLVNKAFPNITINDFYFDILSQGQQHFIALCRKDYVDNVIDTYSKANIYITGIHLGNLSVSSILDFVNAAIIETSNALITTKEKSLENIQALESLTATKNYTINGIDVENTHVLSLISGLRPYLTQKTKTNYQNASENLKNCYLQKRFFNVFSKAALIFLLGLLLINFFFFNHYYNMVNELTEVQQLNESNKTTLLQLTETTNKKKKLVDDLLKSNASKSSYYINAIIKSLPKSILLSDIEYHPLQKRIKPEEEILIDYNTIMVSGETNDNTKLSQWISTLETHDWVKEVSIIDFGDSKRSTANFSIKLHLENDR